ncbi:MAG: hypothetical protein K940chlam5_01693 [Candidatus Anoxychlamydiales bacterium]|nr:hypothetical protein [Candidatus Anoxychlamydiales bacterium]
MTGLSRVRADTVGTITTLSAAPTKETKEPLKKNEEIELDILQVNPDALEETKPNFVEAGYLISPISLDEIKNCEAFKTECCGIIIPKEELIKWDNSNTEFPCPHCRAPLKANDLIEPALLKKEIKKTSIYIISMSVFGCMFLMGATLVIAHSFFSADISFYNNITMISLLAISVTGSLLSALWYSKKRIPIEGLV